MNLFCRHIWKKTEKELIDEYRVSLPHNIPWYDVKEYAVNFECIKCGKKKIEIRSKRTEPDTWEVVA